MPERKISFGGEYIPAKLASTPRIIRATRKIKVTPIAGSNEEVVEMEDAWDCYDQPYSFYVADGSADFVQEAMNEVARVIYKKGWQTLVDEYEPDYFRLAYYKGGFDAENRHTILGKFDLVFRCRPERFLNSGNYPAAFSSGNKIVNPTAYTAKPLIHVTGSGSGTVTVAGKTMSFTDMVDYLNVDCEKQDVYRLPTENKNNLMSGEFPILPSGESEITFTGGITGVEITPRFFVI